MNFYLGVWRSEGPLSDKRAAEQYARLLEGNDLTQGFDPGIYAFCAQLARCYPELDSLSEDEQDSSPWASALEVSGCHAILAFRPERYRDAFPMVLQLADQHGLVCFDPQNRKVHLPSRITDQP